MNKDQNMDRERFAAIIAAYGADPRNWPAAERAGAEAYAAAHAQDHAAALAEAARLDAALASAPAPQPSDLLAHRVLARYAAASRAGPFADARRAALALAACAVVGVLVGFGGARLKPAPPPTDNAESMIGAVFGGGDEFFALMGDGG